MAQQDITNWPQQWLNWEKFEPLDPLKDIAWDAMQEAISRVRRQTPMAQITESEDETLLILTSSELSDYQLDKLGAEIVLLACSIAEQKRREMERDTNDYHQRF